MSLLLCLTILKYCLSRCGSHTKIYSDQFLQKDWLFYTFSAVRYHTHLQNLFQILSLKKMTRRKIALIIASSHCVKPPLIFFLVCSRNFFFKKVDWKKKSKSDNSWRFCSQWSHVLIYFWTFFGHWLKASYSFLSKIILSFYKLIRVTFVKLLFF